MKKLLIGAAMAAIAGATFAQGPNSPPPLPETMPTYNRQPQSMAPIARPTQTREDVVDNVRKHFAKMDSNSDGFIAQDEMQAMRGMRGMRMKKMGERMGKDGERMVMRQGPMADPAAAFDRLDANKDGMISRDEFAKGREIRIERRVEMKDGKAPHAKGHGGQGGMRRMGGMMHGRMMKMADLDKDGRVSLKEAQDSALKHFDMMDSNRDGRLTPEERREMHMKMRNERAPKAS